MRLSFGVRFFTWDFLSNNIWFSYDTVIDIYPFSFVSFVIKR